MAIPIALLLEDKPPVVTITDDETLADAVIMMIANDYTQLPVTSHDNSFNSHCFVTSKSINHALQVFEAPLKELKVKDALVQAKTVSIDEDLFSKMDDLLVSDAVVVIDKEKQIKGIITNYDTTLFLRQRAEDILLVEDIESTLKDHLSITYGDIEDPNGNLQTAINALNSSSDNLVKDIKSMLFKFCDQKNIAIPKKEFIQLLDQTVKNAQRSKTFKDLTLSEFIQLTFNKEAWSTLESTLNIPKAAMQNMLESVRLTRNKLMHFRPDIEEGERKSLRFCANWFKTHQPSSQKALEIVDSIESDSKQDLLDDEILDNENEISVDYFDENDLSNNSKYVPLAKYLSNQSEKKVSLTFDKIEEILDDPLPTSAREHRAWWANDSTSHSQSKLWLEVGWRVTSINMTDQTVIFAKTREREWALIDFFSRTLELMNETYPELPLSNSRPNGRSYQLVANFPDCSLPIIACFASKNRYRIELYIDKGSKEENQLFFNALKKQVENSDSEWLNQLEWEALDGKKACRLALYTPGSIKDSGEKLSRLINWTAEQLPKFYTELQPMIAKIKSA